MQKIHHIHFDRIESTANWVKAHWRDLHPQDLNCVTAASQTAGRGRESRKWVSKRGNLHMTLFYYLPKEDPRLPNLAQLMALAFCEVFPVQIKWPNDLIADRAKLAGILVELIDCGERFGVAHSIGVNVHTPIQTDQLTITLQQWTGNCYHLDALAITLSKALLFQLEKGFSAEAYNSKLIFYGEKGTCVQGCKKFSGIIRGVDQSGRLQLELDNREIVSLSCGDLIVKPRSS